MKPKLVNLATRIHTQHDLSRRRTADAMDELVATVNAATVDKVRFSARQ